MKLKYFAILGLATCAIIVGSFTQASVNSASVKSSLMGPETPFPFAVLNDFPWKTIQGTWQGEDVSTISGMHFSFEVLKNKAGQQVLRVVAIHPSTGEVLAIGIAQPTKNPSVLSAPMSGVVGQFTLYIGSYTSPMSLWRPIVVVTLRPHSANPNEFFMMRKITRAPVSDISAKELGLRGKLQ